MKFLKVRVEWVDSRKAFFLLRVNSVSWPSSGIKEQKGGPLSLEFMQD